MADMNFKQYLNKINEGEEPETLEQQEVKAAEPPKPEPQAVKPAEAGNAMTGVLARYFAKANGDAIVAFDGFASDLRNALSEFLQQKWVPADYFAGESTKQVNFNNKIHELLDVKNLPKLQEFLHGMGVSLQNLKNGSK